MSDSTAAPAAGNGPIGGGRSRPSLQRSNSFQRFRQMEMDAEKEKKQEKERHSTPAKRASIATPSSQRVKAALHKMSVQYMLGRVAASDPALGMLDLTGSGSFLGLTSAQKSRAVHVLSMGNGLHTLKLNTIELTNAHCAALGMLLHSAHRLQCVSLEGNNLTEPGVLEIAAALREHECMQEISLAHQRAPLSTAACGAMVDAMETVPTLVQLNLGTIRDAGMRYRVQTMQSRALERIRQARQRSQTGGDELGGGAPPPMLKRRSLNDTYKGRSGGSASETGEGDATSEALVAPAKLHSLARAIDAAVYGGVQFDDGLWEADLRRQIVRPASDFEVEAADEAQEIAEEDMAIAAAAASAAADAEAQERTRQEHAEHSVAEKAAAEMVAHERAAKQHAAADLLHSERVAAEARAAAEAAAKLRADAEARAAAAAARAESEAAARQAAARRAAAEAAAAKAAAEQQMEALRVDAAAKEERREEERRVEAEERAAAAAEAEAEAAEADAMAAKMRADAEARVAKAQARAEERARKESERAAEAEARAAAATAESEASAARAKIEVAAAKAGAEAEAQQAKVEAESVAREARAQRKSAEDIATRQVLSLTTPWPLPHHPAAFPSPPRGVSLTILWRFPQHAVATASCHPPRGSRHLRSIARGRRWRWMSCAERSACSRTTRRRGESVSGRRPWRGRRRQRVRPRRNGTSEQSWPRPRRRRSRRQRPFGKRWRRRSQRRGRRGRR